MKILLAVSGGIDSMYMAERAPVLFPGAVFGVAHCNFSLRGEESDGDETFVRRWTEAHGMEFFSVRFDTAGYASENSLSTEMAARELRYRWFASILRERGFDAVAVAHNACDNAETFFLNLLRGTGTRGLRGMESDTVIEGAHVLRPLLGTSREEIEGWMRSGAKQWREDRTNRETVYRRNRIRHDVMPVLKDLNPSFLRTLARDMAHIREADEIAGFYWEDAVSRGTVAFGENGLRIDIAKLLAEKSPKYLLFRALESRGFNEETIDSVMDLLASGRTVSGKVFEAEGWILECSSTQLTVLPPREGQVSSVEVTGPGEYMVGGVSFRVSSLAREEVKSLIQPHGTLVFDEEKLPFPFRVRTWKDGDYLIPLGMRGKKKLSDLFVDLKWGPEKKRTALVLSADDSSRVLGLLGERVDGSIKIDEGTKSTIKLVLTSK